MDADVSPKALDDFKRGIENRSSAIVPSSISTSSVAATCLTCSTRRRTSPATTSTSSGSFGATTRTPMCKCSGGKRSPKEAPAADEPSPQRSELCNVPVGQAANSWKRLPRRNAGLDTSGITWTGWQVGEARSTDRCGRDWRSYCPAAAGGYDWDDESKTGKGWDADSKAVVTPLPLKQKMRGEAVGSDLLSEQSRPLTIAVHTQNVCEELSELLPAIKALLDHWPSILESAARWHDVGKAHDAFQTGMRTRRLVARSESTLGEVGHQGSLAARPQALPPRVGLGAGGASSSNCRSPWRI